MRLTPTAQNEAADAVCPLLDGGWLEIMDGEMVLVRLRFASPAFQDAVGGTARANSMNHGKATRSGVAKSYRTVSLSGQIVFEGTADALGLYERVIEEGAPVFVKEFKYTQPQE